MGQRESEGTIYYSNMHFALGYIAEFEVVHPIINLKLLLVTGEKDYTIEGDMNEILFSLELGGRFYVSPDENLFLSAGVILNLTDGEYNDRSDYNTITAGIGYKL